MSDMLHNERTVGKCVAALARLFKRYALATALRSKIFHNIRPDYWNGDSAECS